MYIPRLEQVHSKRTMLLIINTGETSTHQRNEKNARTSGCDGKRLHLDRLGPAWTAKQVSHWTAINRVL